MSAVKEMLELLDLGTKMGLKEEDLQQFVKDEQARMRDEHEKNRAERQEKEEREFKFSLERERTVREHNKREHTRLMEEKKEYFAIPEHQRKLEELEHEDKIQLERSDTTTHDEKETFQPVKAPKLSPFEDSKDSIDAYIQRFKIYAISQKWHKDTWWAHLNALLKRKALNAFARLSPETALDIGELKNALLKRFDMTEDDFHKKFRFSKPDWSETFVKWNNSLQDWTVTLSDGFSYRGLTERLKIWRTCSCVNSFSCVVPRNLHYS